MREKGVPRVSEGVGRVADTPTPSDCHCNAVMMAAMAMVMPASKNQVAL